MVYFIYETFKRINYMMMYGQDILIFTDHKNLLFIYHPISVEPSSRHHKMMKVAWWDLFLSKVNFITAYMKRESDDFSDILMHWMKGYKMSKCSICRARKVLAYFEIGTSRYRAGLSWRHYYTNLERSITSGNFQWTILKMRGVFCGKPRKKLISENAIKLKLRL